MDDYKKTCVKYHRVIQYLPALQSCHGPADGQSMALNLNHRRFIRACKIGFSRLECYARVELLRNVMHKGQRPKSLP